MLVDLEETIRLFYRLSSGFSSGLDRALGKYSNLSDSLRELTDATQHLRQDLDSYCRKSSSSSFDTMTSEASAGPVVSDGHTEGADVSSLFLDHSQHDSTALKLDPDRIQFKHQPSFQAESFISDPLLKACFLNPRHIRTPKQSWPRVRPARVMC